MGQLDLGMIRSSILHPHFQFTYNYLPILCGRLDHIDLGAFLGRAVREIVDEFQDTISPSRRPVWIKSRIFGN